MSDCEKVMIVEGDVEEAVSETSVVDLGEEISLAVEDENGPGLETVPAALTNPTGITVYRIAGTSIEILLHFHLMLHRNNDRLDSVFTIN